MSLALIVLFLAGYYRFRIRVRGRYFRSRAESKDLRTPRATSPPMDYPGKGD